MTSLINQVNVFNRMLGSMMTLKSTERKELLQSTMDEINTIISTKSFNPNEITEEGYSPLMYIMKSYFYISEKMNDDIILSFYEKMMSDLVSSGLSNLEHVDKEGNTALILACCEGILEMENFIITMIKTGKSNPGKASNFGGTALMCACSFEMEDVALALIETGKSNPGQVQENLKTTALILACTNNLPEVALELIATGESKPFYKNKRGKTALDIASQIPDDMQDVIDVLKDMKEEEESRTTHITPELDVNQEGFNAVAQERKLVKDHIAENKDNLVFMVNNNYYLTNKNELATQFRDKNHIKYGCLDAGDNEYDDDDDLVGIDFTGDANIDYENRYFSMSAIFGLQILVRASQIINILLKSNKNQLYVVQPTNITLPAIISNAYIDGASGSSADHCQTGKSTQVYTIERGVGRIFSSSVIETATATTTATNSVNILYKGVTYPFTMDENTTLGQMKTLFLNALISKGDPLVKSLNFHVKFIYGGKIHIEDDKLLKDIATPPFAMQAMVSPKTGGKKKKTQKRNRNRKTYRKKVKRNTRKR